MAVARYLADKSALARINNPSVQEYLAPLIAGGHVVTCAVVMLEVLYSADSVASYMGTRNELHALDRLPVEECSFERALEVQGLLAAKSQHRGASLPDLLIAAVAERFNLTVLHYDSDFDRIAAVTGQPTEWVVKRGSVP